MSGKMKKQQIAISSMLFAIIALSIPSVSLAAQAERIKQYQAWGAYKYAGSAQGQLCYALSTPIKQLPVSVNHGENYFLVTKIPNEKNVRFEAQLVAGYSYKPNAEIVVTVGKDSFTFFSQGNLAWLEDSKVSDKLVEAMKKGSSLTVKATSTRGTSTEYTYSLSGISAALKTVTECK